MKFTFSSQLALAMACAGLAGAAQAQTAGTWLVKGGINQVAPQVTSGNLSAPSLPETQVDVEAATSVIVTGTYMYTDHIAFEAFGGLPYEHDIIAKGAMEGTGKIASVKQAAPLLLAQYRFMEPNSAFRPYVGAGLTFAYFFGEEGSGALTASADPGGPPTKLEAESAFGVAFQVGGSYFFDKNWYVDAAIIKVLLENTNKLSTGQSIDTKLDPLVSNISVGYRF